MNPVLQFVLVMLGCGIVAWVIECALDGMADRWRRRRKVR